MSAAHPLDALIIGAGPAGLAAAIYLGRFKRRFAVVHGGDTRASYIPLSRNHPGFPDGISGPDLLGRMQLQAERFGAVLRPGVVTNLRSQDGGFAARLADGGDFAAATVLLATGVKDVLPPLAGAEDAVRKGLLRVCPICDGFEAQGKNVGVIGEGLKGAREAHFLTIYSQRVCFIHVGTKAQLPADERLRLEHAGIEVLDSAERDLALDPDGASAICFSEGEIRHFDVLYSALGTRPRSELATQVAASIDPDGRLTVTDHQETSVEGLFAAGDLVRGLNQISTAEGEAAIAATAIHNRLRER
jgi:thioredoxin reductase (NADPH)